MYPPNYSAKDTAITQRPPSSALLAIDSEDRFKDYESKRADLSGIDITILPTGNWSPYDFTINKRESLMNGFFTRLSVSEVVFPWVIPNINPRTHIIGVSLYNGGVLVDDFEVSVPYGFYTPANLAANLQVQIRALDPLLLPFTMTYGVRTLVGTAPEPIFEYKTNAVGITIAFQPAEYSQATYPYPASVKQLFDLLGFNDSAMVPAVSGCGGATFCQAIRYVDIVCSVLTNNQALKDTMSQTIARDSLCRIYLADAGTTPSNVLPSSASFCPPGCAPLTLYRNFSVPKYIQWLPNQPVPGSLRFEVFDDIGRNLEESYPSKFVLTGGVVSIEPNTTDWSMTMLVSEN